MQLFKKRRKYKYINGSKGVISLFLCLIMTPVLTLASALIEFSRYQNTESVCQEVMDCASLSTLANYDSYLEERFGLFAFSQDKNMQDIYKKSLLQNSGVMEGISLGNDITTEGIYPLSDTDVIKRQILDFSESTVLTDIVLEDLQLQTLLEELDKLMAIGGLMDTLTNMHTMTTQVKDLVSEAQKLVKKVKATAEKGDELKAEILDLSTAISDLYKTISENGFTIDSSSEDKENESYEAIIKKYVKDIEKIYVKAQDISETASSMKTSVEEIYTNITNLEKKCTEIKKTVKNVSDSTKNVASASDTGSAGEGESSVEDVGNQSTSLYVEVVNTINDALKEAKGQLSESVRDAFKESVSDLQDNLVEGLGLDFVNYHVATQKNKEYFTFPLSEDRLDRLKTFIDNIPEVWGDKSSDDIKSLVKNNIPKILSTNVIKTVKSTINSAVTSAKKKFTDNVGDSVGKLLTDLVDTVKGLFDLDVFYDGSLNAFLSDETVATLLSDTGGKGADQTNPYVSLLSALSSMMQSVEDFNDAIKSINFFSLISAITNLCSAIKSTVQSVVQLTAKTVEKIGELVTWVKDGDWDHFAELLLMAGYMTHNLPNRTMVGKTNVSIDGGVAMATALTGETLTGFPFSNIKTPAKVFSTGIGANAKENQSSLSALVDFLGSTTTGGSDAMFRGAELEYILAGTQSELMNQTVVFMQLYFLRLLVDLVTVFTDPAVTTMASAATIACWAVYLIVAFAEPLCDTVLLVNGSEDVYFIKRSCYLTPTGLPKLASQLSSVVIKNKKISKSAVDQFNKSTEGKFDKYTNSKMSFSNGILKMNYATHCLLILMFTTTTEDMLRRMANIVQLETNYNYSQQKDGHSFDISKAYTGISASAEVEFNSFINIFQTENGLIKKRFTRQSTY